MLLPENVRMIAPEDRDQDGLYVIDSGIIHVHRFMIPLLGSITIELQHGVGGQDHSVHVWLGYQPLNDVIDKPFGREALDREPLTYELFDSINAPAGVASLPSGRVIYLNVLNCQNSRNNYKLVFSTD